MNLGKSIARECRDDLAQEFNAWSGHVLVIDGELSDEIADYADYNRALLGLIDRCAKAGYDARREFGDDGSDRDQKLVASEFAKKVIFVPPQVVVTGAWRGHKNSGCVNSVVAELRRSGWGHVQFSESAVHEDIDFYEQRPRFGM